MLVAAGKDSGTYRELGVDDDDARLARHHIIACDGLQ